MALTSILLSDPISTLVTKTNAIITDVGNKDNLTTTAKSDLVVAINEINATLGTIDTEAEIAAQVETFFNTQGHVLDVRGFHADSANIDSASITNLAVGSFIQNSTGPILRLNDTDGVLGANITSRVNFQATGADQGEVGFGTTVGNMVVKNVKGNLLLQADQGNTHTDSKISFHVDGAENAFINASGFSFKMDGISALAHVKSLEIKNSAGTTVLAGYLLSTSNTDGTL